MKFNDPSGHCATPGSGGPDMDGDGECWQLAYQIYGLSTRESFATDWQISGERWLQEIATQGFADAGYLQPFADRYQTEWAREVGLPIDKVVWHEPPKHPLQRMSDYCKQNGCIGGALNSVSIVASTIAVACASSVIGNAGCSQVAGGVGFVAGIIGTGVTTAKAVTNQATTIDVTISVGTTVVGGFPVVGQSSKVVGFGAALIQLLWDSYGSDKNRVSGYAQ